MQSILQERNLRTAALVSVHNKKRSSSTSSAQPQTDTWLRPRLSLVPVTSLNNQLVTLVDWEGEHDPEDPRNWSPGWKFLVQAIVFFDVFVLNYASGADSQDNARIADAFGVSAEAESASPALYVFGIACGSLLAAPISETVGRNPVYIASLLWNCGFLLGTALAPNFGAQCVFRFLAGFGGSIVLSVHGASIADIYAPGERSMVWPIVSLGSFLGTVASPIVGGWIANTSTLSWRVTEWITFGLSATAFLVTLLFLPETFASTLLKWKAAHVRQITQSNAYRSPLDLQASFNKRIAIAAHRAWIMLTREWIVIALGTWLVVVYVVIYGFLQGFTALFSTTYTFSHGLTGTAFAAIGLGVTLGTALALALTRHQTQHPRAKDLAEPASEGTESDRPPELRLWLAFPMAVTLPTSLFWLGWTNSAAITPWSGLCAAVLFGFSWSGIYIAVYNYILDVYGTYAGSALASMTGLRYLVAAGVVLVSRPMYDNLGTHWTCTLLGFLGLALAPVPFVLYWYGRWIRAHSEFAGEEIELCETMPEIDEAERVGQIGAEVVTGGRGVP